MPLRDFACEGVRSAEPGCAPCWRGAGTHVMAGGDGQAKTVPLPVSLAQISSAHRVFIAMVTFQQGLLFVSRDYMPYMTVLEACGGKAKQFFLLL